MAYSIEPFKLWVSGLPHPQIRPRAVPRMFPRPGTTKCSRCGERPKFMSVQMVSKPKGSAIAEWRNGVKSQLSKATSGRELLGKARPYIWGQETGLQVVLDFVMPRPKNHWSATKAKPTGKYKEAQHLSRPDVDNLAKAVLDELEGIVFQRDEQVVNLQVAKRYEAAPHTAGVHISVRPFRAQPLLEHGTS